MYNVYCLRSTGLILVQTFEQFQFFSCDTCSVLAQSRIKNTNKSRRDDYSQINLILCVLYEEDRMDMKLHLPDYGKSLKKAWKTLTETSLEYLIQDISIIKTFS